jgi:hypothetical protein
MSLKAFHIIFVIVSTMLAFGVGGLCLNNYFHGDPDQVQLGVGIAFSVSGVLLLVYGRYFLKKLKHISYL